MQSRNQSGAPFTGAEAQRGNRHGRRARTVRQAPRRALLGLCALIGSAMIGPWHANGEALTTAFSQPGEETKGREGAGKKTVSSQILSVKLALFAEPDLFPYDIEVESSADGVVLSGKVSNDTEKTLAAEAARNVSGVVTVTNKIEIVKELTALLSHKRDANITQQVRERFAKSATLKAAGFDISTVGGVITLKGTVRFQVFVLEAVEAAREIPGVKAVRTDGVRIESEG